MDENVKMTLTLNTGIIIEYGETKILMDVIYGYGNHLFSNYTEEQMKQMLDGEPPYDNVDYLIYTHKHDDHYSENLTVDYLENNKVKGILLPDDKEMVGDGIKKCIEEQKISCVLFSKDKMQEEIALGNDIYIKAIPTLHLDRKCWDVFHLCFIMRFGNKKILFTSDVDYTQETFEEFSDDKFEAVFVNPYFFSAIAGRQFFKGDLKADNYCIYHMPREEEDTMMLYPLVRKALSVWEENRGNAILMNKQFQVIEV